MSVAATTENKILYTPEDLLAISDGKNYGDSSLISTAVLTQTTV